MITVIATTYANVYEEASFSSQLVSQGLMWERVKILDKKDDWNKIVLPDGYSGWCQSFSLTDLSEEMGGFYKQKHKVLISEPFLQIKKYNVSDTLYEKKALSAVGIKFPVSQNKGNWSEIVLPNGEKGWIQQPQVPHLAIREKLVFFAEKFFGCPYLWGGKTEFGLDCSGFIQAVFHSCRIKLPRDAGQQFEKVKKNALEQNDPLPGDLIFFSNDDGKIVHVALSLGGMDFIHASGKVKINSLNKASENYSDKLAAMKPVIYSIESLISK